MTLDTVVANHSMPLILLMRVTILHVEHTRIL
jgi:hypothetical protein